MAIKKDLVEAHAFSRRRLVTAFVSGAPGGREVEPARPGRSVVGGLALAVLVLAGAAILGVFQDRDGVDWGEVGLVRDDRGALYVILEDDPAAEEPRVRQVLNVTSAQLIVGSEVEVQEASAEEIADQEKGPPIGILGAPSSVPPSSDLLPDDWTACTATDLGVRASISPDTLVTAAEPGQPFLVSAGGDQFVIATGPRTDTAPERAYSYRIPADADARIYTALGLGDPTRAIEVPERWLSLFPPGGALDAEGLSVPGFGEPIGADLRQAGFPGAARNGDYFEANGTYVVLTADGLVTLTPFAFEVLQVTDLPAAGGGGGGVRAPREIDEGSADLAYGGVLAAASNWPAEVPAVAPPSPIDTVCAVLQSTPGEAPGVTLALAPTDAAAPDEVARGIDPVVAPGHGALVSVGDWSLAAGGSPNLIDDRAISYRLASQVEVDYLGYGSVSDVVVPDTWLKLFDTGVELSRDDALCPPTDEVPSCTPE